MMNDDTEIEVINLCQIFKFEYLANLRFINKTHVPIFLFLLHFTNLKIFNTYNKQKSGEGITL